MISGRALLPTTLVSRRANELTLIKIGNSNLATSFLCLMMTFGTFLIMCGSIGTVRDELSFKLGPLKVKFRDILRKSFTSLRQY
jgi:hypothetical protein